MFWTQVYFRHMLSRCFTQSFTCLFISLICVFAEWFNAIHIISFVFHGFVLGALFKPSPWTMWSCMSSRVLQFLIVNASLWSILTGSGLQMCAFLRFLWILGSETACWEFHLESLNLQRRFILTTLRPEQGVSLHLFICIWFLSTVSSFSESRYFNFGGRYFTY